MLFLRELLKMARIKGFEPPFHNNGERQKYYTRTSSAHVDKPAPQQSLLSEYCCGGGGIFFCILLLAMVMIFLIVQLFIWRIFDIDIFPVDDTISNKELSNYTFSSFHRPTD